MRDIKLNLLPETEEWFRKTLESSFGGMGGSQLRHINFNLYPVAVEVVMEI